MDAVPIIVSTVLLIIIVPTIGYLFITTDHKDRLAAHIESDEENFREIRHSLDRLGTKIDNKFDTLITVVRSNGK